MFIINQMISEKKLCLNEVRQSVITHKITDLKVLSHKKAHKDAHRRGKGTRKNYEYYVLYRSFPFQILWQISSGKREKE
jgi:tRNA U38,U39,U40 pseudouridine synthase TruA